MLLKLPLLEQEKWAKRYHYAITIDKPNFFLLEKKNRYAIRWHRCCFCFPESSNTNESTAVVLKSLGCVFFEMGSDSHFGVIVRWPRCHGYLVAINITPP
ncbi:hypothetical protein CDAR_438711 [Caerostris darwini]|uniref:Uncharacterized protein n=1 Tax=Caerostris darwini TaxID=1538125 RepID=A0AAV4X4U0_9ARAC|nr:hypothetical protein CDAR_438711 [Caerostris darwini]